MGITKMRTKSSELPIVKESIGQGKLLKRYGMKGFVIFATLRRWRMRRDVNLKLFVTTQRFLRVLASGLLIKIIEILRLLIILTHG
jgi:hypothetical protein